MVASEVEQKDADIVRLAPHERPLDAAALARLKDSIRDELRRRIHPTRRAPVEAPGSDVLQHALVRAFGPDRSTHERRLFYLCAAPLVRALLLQRAGAASCNTLRRLAMLALDASLRRLETVAPRQACMIDLHYFAGLTLWETAGLLGQTEAAVKRDLRFIKAWLANMHRHYGGF
jgi:hypothetical protein